MPSNSKIVLITGCTEGSLGDALCRAFHNAGHSVIATARNPAKLANLKALGIQTLALDVCSSESIQKCFEEVQLQTQGQLDILINNAGASYNMPFSDISIPEAKKLFDLNVWAQIEMTQVFLPLLIKSKGVIVNHTSLASIQVTPFCSAYCASKAALAAFSDNLRVEMSPFGVRVVELKSGSVRSPIFTKMAADQFGGQLPEDSIYAPARELVVEGMRSGKLEQMSIDADVWAKGVVQRVTQDNPERRVWLGGSAFGIWFYQRFLPADSLEWAMKRMWKFGEMEKLIKGQAEKQ